MSSSSKIKLKAVKCMKCNKNVRKLIECSCCKEAKHLNCSSRCKEGEVMTWKCYDCTSGASMNDGVGTPIAGIDATVGIMNSDVNVINGKEVCELKSLVYSMLEDIRLLKEDNKFLRGEMVKLSKKSNSTDNDGLVSNSVKRRHSVGHLVTQYEKCLLTNEKNASQNNGVFRKNSDTTGTPSIDVPPVNAATGNTAIEESEVTIISDSETSGYQIETIINKKSTKVEQVLKDAIVMGDSLVRLASQVMADLKECTYFYPGMRLENVAQALERLLMNRKKPKTLLLHFGTNNVKGVKCIDQITGEAYDMVTNVKKLVPNTHIILNGILTRRDVSGEIIKRINENLQWVCSVHCVTFANPNEKIGNINVGLARDGLHLNMRGAMDLGQVLISEIMECRSKN